MRKSRAKKRILMPDPKFGSVLVTRFVNNLMLYGKKSVAFKVFYDALDLVSSKVDEEEVLVSDGSELVKVDLVKQCQLSACWVCKMLIKEVLFLIVEILLK